VHLRHSGCAGTVKPRNTRNDHVHSAPPDDGVITAGNDHYYVHATPLIAAGPRANSRAELRGYARKKTARYRKSVIARIGFYDRNGDGRMRCAIRVVGSRRDYGNDAATTEMINGTLNKYVDELGGALISRPENAFTKCFRRDCPNWILSSAFPLSP